MVSTDYKDSSGIHKQRKKEKRKKPKPEEQGGMPLAAL
jgi:hypothetical protein